MNRPVLGCTTRLLAVLLPALLQSALIELPQAECLESSDGVNLMQTQKGRVAHPPQNYSGTESRTARPGRQGATESSREVGANHELLPQVDSIRVALVQQLKSVSRAVSSDPASLYARFTVVLIVGLCFICCAIGVTVNVIKSPSMAQPLNTDDLQAKRQQLLAAIRANVPPKPYGPPVPVAEAHDAAGSQPAAEQGLMAPMPGTQMQWPRDQGQPVQGQQMPQGGSWPGRGRDVIVQHPLEGGRLGINLTNEDLVITGLLDSRAEAFGFVAGDRVTHINSVPVRNRADFVEALKAAMQNNKAYGQPVVVHVVNRLAPGHLVQASQAFVQQDATGPSQDISTTPGGMPLDVTMPASPPRLASEQPDPMSTQLPVYAAPEPSPFDTQKNNSSAIFQQPDTRYQASVSVPPQTQTGGGLPVPRQADEIHSRSAQFAAPTDSPQQTLQALQQPALLPVYQSPPQTLQPSQLPAPLQNAQS